MTARTWIRFAVSLLLFLIFLLHTSDFAHSRLLERIEALTYDARIRLTLLDSPSPDVVILDVDERTIAAEGWPWSRNKWADLIQVLFSKYEPRVVGFDIAFAEPDATSGAALLKRLADKDLADLPGFKERVAGIADSLDYDAQFAAAIRGKPVVLGYFFKPQVAEGEPKATGALCGPLMDKATAGLYAVDFIMPQGFGGNVAELQAGTPYCGFFDNPSLDDDGIYRRVPLIEQYEGALYPSLALEVARVALGKDAGIGMEFDPPDARSSLNLERVRVGDRAVPVDGKLNAYVPYRGPYRTFRYISITDVLHGVTDAASLKNAIVVIGTSAGGLLDQRTTPVGRAYAGVEVHANLISGILENRVRQKAPYYMGIETVMTAIIAIVVAWFFPRVSPLVGASIGLGIIAAIVILAMAMWSGERFIMPMGVPIVFTLAVFMSHLLYGYFVESRGKRSVEKRFGQYVPPQLVEELAARPEMLSMEGETREMTVLFSDVRGFTSISEKLEARELSQLMNMFLTKETGVIQQHRGTIDKYMGDAIMAFWGAPLKNEAHALNALEAGMAMVKAVRELDEEFKRRGWPPLHIGVGVNSGPMRVGNMGSEFRVAYTVMGDAVNLGSRVEGQTKTYGVSILCTEHARAGAPADWSFREIDLVRVKGKNEPVMLYEPLGPKDSIDPALRQDLARHRGAMKLYRKQKWDEAEVELFNLSKSGRPHPVYDLFLKRIQEYRKNPPPPNWDGAKNMTEK